MRFRLPNILPGTCIAVVLALHSATGIPQRTCKATQTVLPDGTQWWHQRVSVDGGRTWKLISVRPGVQAKKAMRDCFEWLKKHK